MFLYNSQLLARKLHITDISGVLKIYTKIKFSSRRLQTIYIHILFELRGAWKRKLSIHVHMIIKETAHNI